MRLTKWYSPYTQKERSKVLPTYIIYFVSLWFSKMFNSKKKMSSHIDCSSLCCEDYFHSWYHFITVCDYVLLHLDKVLRELSGVILARGPKLCNFVEWREYKVVYKRWVHRCNYAFAYEDRLLTSSLLGLCYRILFLNVLCRYASLYFCMCIDQDDNELEVLEIIHHFVEILDRYFGSVSETWHFVLHFVLIEGVVVIVCSCI